MNGLHAGRTPQRIVDVLDMEHGWMTAHALMADLQLRWGHITLPTVRRAVHRLTERGLVESRLTLMPSTRNNTQNVEELEVRL